MISQLISSFNAGEFSPYLEARTNLEKYRNSCKVLENMVITPYGPANRRAGTEYLGGAKSNSTRCRLVGLDISDTNHIVMELGVGYIRFWKDRALITSGGNPVEATRVDYLNEASASTPIHPYQEGDIRNVQVCQINNLIYLSHPSYPPQRLSRISDTNWTIGEVPFGDPSIKNNWAPMLDQNVTTTTINPTASTGTLTGVSFAYSTTTVTATKAGHNLTEGQQFTVSGATGASAASYNGTWVVDDVLSSSKFTFIVTTAPTAVSTGTVVYENPGRVGETITLAASSGIFQAGHVGSYWEIAHPNSTAFISQNIDNTNSTSTTIKILGKWSLQTFGTWNAQVDLQASTDSGTTWKTVRTYKSSGDYNATSSGEEQVETLFRFKVRGFKATTSATTPRILLSPLDPTLSGLVRITEFTNSTTVTARVLKSLGGTGPTSQWREGAFSAVQGYPAAVALHDNRVIFAGTSSNPSSIWGSYTNDFQNFKQGAYDADSFFFTLASTTGGAIQWLVSKSALLIGTTLDEWSMAASDQTRPITPTNVNVRQQSHYGSSPIGAQIINDTVLYIQRMSRKIRELVYTWSSESWVSNDITALAEHTTRTGILETAYQRVPDAILWFVRGDGQLVSMTYEREQQVVGFARHITDGVVESVATINGTNAEDEVWLLVRRTIGSGTTVRYIERLKLGMRDALDTADKANWWFVDSGLLKVASTSTGKTTGIAGTYTKVVSTTTTTDAQGNSISVPITTITVTSAGHGLSIGSTVRVKAATYTITVDGLPVSVSDTSLIENFAVTSVTTNTFTFSPDSSSLVGTGAMSFDFVTARITGLSHLEGKAVSVWADNAVGSLVVTQPTVVGGQITLQIPASRVLVGLPFTSTLVPQRVDTNLQDGTSQGRRMRIPRMNIKVYQSTGGELSTDGVNWFPLVSRVLTDNMDSSPPVLNGYERAYASSNWADGVDLYVRQSQPVPFTVAALVVNFEVSEATQN